MSELPKGWAKVCIADVVDKPKQNKPEADENIIYVDIGSINREKKVIENPQQLLGADAPSRARKRINTDDVLVSLTRPNLNAVAIVPEYLDQQYASTGFDVLKPNSIHPKFLFYLVRTRKFIDAISGKVQGALYPAAKSSDVQSFEFHAPNLEEQKRIADKLDSVLAKVEAAQARLDKIPAILKRFRQSVLAAATSGELTKEWREKRNHSTEDMLSGFEELAAPPRYASRNKGFIFGINATSVGTPSTAAVRQWKWVPLVKVAQMSSGHTPSRSKPEYWGGSINWLGIKDAREHHSKEINSTIQKTNELGVSNSATRILPKGTICISRTASVGYVVKLGADMCTSQDFVNWTCSEVVDADWLKWLFVAEKEALFKFGKGTTHTTVYFPEWLSINILLPPIEEQQEIVRIIDGLFCKADRIERQFNDTKLRINKLTQSVLAKAFKGELLTSSVDSDIESIENSIEALNA